MEDKIFISESSIAKYLHRGLIAKGYVPETDELFDIAEILFDFLIDCQVFEGDIEEEDIEEEF